MQLPRTALALVLATLPAWAGNKPAPYLLCLKGLGGGNTAEPHPSAYKAKDKANSDLVVLPERSRKVQGKQKKGFYVVTDRGAHFFTYSEKITTESGKIDFIEGKEHTFIDMHRTEDNTLSVALLPKVFVETMGPKSFSQLKGADVWDDQVRAEISAVIVQKINSRAEHIKGFRNDLDSSQDVSRKHAYESQLTEECDRMLTGVDKCRALNIGAPAKRKIASIDLATSCEGYTSDDDSE